MSPSAHGTTYNVRVAMHEAAHAAVALYFGLRPASVTMVPTDALAGGVVLDDLPSAPLMAQVEMVAMVNLAGLVQDHMFIGLDVRADLEQAARRPRGADDASQAIAAIRTRRSGGCVERAMQLAERVEAIMDLPVVSDSIFNIATALVEHGTLSGDDVLQIVSPELRRIYVTGSGRTPRGRRVRSESS